MVQRFVQRLNHKWPALHQIHLPLCVKTSNSQRMELKDLSSIKKDRVDRSFSNSNLSDGFFGRKQYATSPSTIIVITSALDITGGRLEGLPSRFFSTTWSYSLQHSSTGQKIFVISTLAIIGGIFRLFNCISVL